MLNSVDAPLSGSADEIVPHQRRTPLKTGSSESVEERDVEILDSETQSDDQIATDYRNSLATVRRSTAELFDECDGVRTRNMVEGISVSMVQEEAVLSLRAANPDPGGNSDGNVGSSRDPIMAQPVSPNAVESEIEVDKPLRVETEESDSPGRSSVQESRFVQNVNISNNNAEHMPGSLYLSIDQNHLQHLPTPRTSQKCCKSSNKGRHRTPQRRCCH